MTFDSVLKDVRYALRGLTSRPGFTAAVVATLALGVGANTAMFGIVDQLLFRPPPMLKNAALVHRPYFFGTPRGKEETCCNGRYVRYKQIEEWTTSFSSHAGYTTNDQAVGTGDEAREMRIGSVSASFFGFFDAPPVVGRYFNADEDQVPSGTPVVVLSHAFWSTRYGARNDVIGSTLHIGPTVYTIIGVSPRGFVGLWPDQPPAAFIPITSYAAGNAVALRTGTWWTTFSWGWMNTMVMRKPEVTIAQANADLTNALQRSYQSQLEEQPSSTPIDVLKPRAQLGSILPARGPNASADSKVATWLGAVSIIVLLIACANVANLLLGHTLRRRREIALRLALGVTRLRLARLLLTETVVLALLGGTAGLLIAHWGSAALKRIVLERGEPLPISDTRTLLFAAATAVGLGLLCGLAPLVQASRADLTSDLKSGVREGTRQGSRTRTALLLLQSALSVVLLTGAGLFVQSLRNVQSADLGYDVDPVLLVNLNMRGVTIDSAAQAQLRRSLRQTASAIPGVENASLQLTVPFWSTWNFGLTVAGIDSVHLLGNFELQSASPEHFETFGTRILRGRGITSADVAGAPLSMVVSESMGRLLWPGKDPIGECIKLGADSLPCHYVVGIAQNIRTQDFRPDSSHLYYLANEQFRPNRGGLFIRAHGRGGDMIETVRSALQREMPGASYVTVTPFSEIVGGETRSWRLGATMFTLFGGLALLLAAIGLYSVVAYDVAQRTHEMGVRRALGAQASDAIRLVVSGGLRVAVVGVVAGLATAYVAAPYVEPLLFNVPARAPGVLGTVAAVLLLVALAATWIPARRAARVDPNVALRSD